MKKFLSVLLVLCMALSAVSIPSFAEGEEKAKSNVIGPLESDNNFDEDMALEFGEYTEDDADLSLEETSGDYNYTVSNNQATITGYNGAGGAITIPSTLGGYPVVTIGERAFYDCYSLTSVNIPNSVTSIGKRAFVYCESLTSVTIPNSVTSIGDRAFCACTSLTSVTIPNSVTSIGEEVFFGCTSLTSVTIPNSVTSIGYSAFSTCTSLTSVTIGNSVTRIGERAFSYCTSLTSVTIPDSVESIGGGTFYGCTSMTSVTIGNGVTSIGEEAFEDCSSLTEIKWNAKNVADFSLSNYVFYNTGTSGDGINVIFGDSVERIPAFCFDASDLDHRPKITSVTIGNSVKSIGESAFNTCTSLESVTIGNNVTSIGSYAFAWCEGLTSVALGNSVTSIGREAFIGCKELTSITIPDSVTSIGDYTFYWCENLISVDISDSITNIGNGAFSFCYRLISVDVPDGVTSIGEYAFESCTSLISVTIPGSVTSIGWDAFCDCDKLTLEVVPDSYGEKYAIENGISYEYYIEATKAEITLTDGEKEITEGYIVNWYDGETGKSLGKGKILNGIDYGKEYCVEIEFGEDLSYKYKNPEKMTVIPTEDNFSFNCVLEPLGDIKVSGKVFNALKETIDNADAFIEQTFNGKYIKSHNLKTDAKGEFSFDGLKNVPTKITVSKEGYYNKIKRLDLSDDKDSYTEEFSMIKLPENKIGLSMTKHYAAAEGEEGTSTVLTSANNLSFAIFNTTQDKDIEDFEVQYPYIILGDGMANPNDEIIVSPRDNKNEMTAAPVSITLDENKTGDVSIDFVENGHIEISEITGNPKNTIMLFDERGNIIKSSTVTSSYKSDFLPKGSYTLLFIKKTDLLRSVPNIAKLAEMGLIENTDYLTKNISVENGKISETEKVTVPAFDESKLYYTIPENTGFSANNTSVSVGRYITFKVEYEIDNKHATSDQTVIIEFPEKLEFTDKSLTIDGKKAAYTQTGNTVTVNVGSTEGVIRFYGVATERGSHNVNAYLSFKNGDSDVTQPIGTATVEAESAKISVPGKTGQKTVTVTGTTVANGNVTLYDNDTEVGNTKANGAGSWSMRFNLVKSYNYSYHNIYAEISSDKFESKIKTDMVSLLYDENYTELSKVTMINTAHPVTSLNTCEFVTEFDFLNPRLVVPSYNYWESYPKFTFKVEFTGGDDTTLSDVYVVTTNSAGDKTYVPCSYDKAMGMWLGTHDYYTYNEVPVKVNVVYSGINDLDNLVIDREMIADTIKIIDNEYTETSNQLKEIEETFDYVADDTLTIDETYALINQKYDNIESEISNFNDISFLIFDNLGVKTDVKDDIVYTIIDGCRNNITINSCEGITGKELIDDGFELIKMSDGSCLYMKVCEDKCSIVDFVQDSYIVIDMTKVAELSGINELMLMASGDMQLDVAGMKSAFDKVNTILTAIKDIYESVINTIDESINSLSFSIGECKNLQLQAAADKIKYQTKITELKAGGASDRIIKYYEDCLNMVNKREKTISDSIEGMKNKLSAFKALNKALLALNVAGLISNIVDLRVHITKLTELYLSVPEKCDPDQAEADAIRKELVAIGAGVIAFFGLNIYGSIVGISAAIAVGAAAPPTAIASIIAIPAIIAGAIASAWGFDWVMENNYKIYGDRIKNLSCSPDDDPAPPGWNNLPNPKTPDLPVQSILDPSGYIYEAVPSNRVEGVKAEAYYYDYELDEFGFPTEEKSDIFWDAENYDQVNPLYTDKNGMYAWDVPMGQWLVKFSKDGYYDTDSKKDIAADEEGYLPVPPPQTEVNTAIVSKEAPKVESVNIYENEIQIIFSKYMKLDTVNIHNVKVFANGEEVSGTIMPENNEFDLQGENEYASIFKFVPDETLNGSVTVTVENSVGYNDKALTEKYTESKIVEKKPEGITLPENMEIKYSSGGLAEIAVYPYEAGANKNLAVKSSAPSIVGVVTETVTTDESGKANVMLNGNLPGEGEITVSLDGTDISAKTMIKVANVENNDNKCEKVTASIEAGSTVKKGTKVELSTKTEGAEIYYTTDGSCPCTVGSPSRIKYTEPIEITEDVLIIAYAVKEGMEDSNTAGFTYTISDTLSGDVNNDGSVDDMDWTIIFNHVSYIIENKDLPNWDDDTKYNKSVFTAADVNNDGNVDDMDWTIIFNHVSYIIENENLPKW